MTNHEPPPAENEAPTAPVAPRGTTDSSDSCATTDEMPSSPDGLSAFDANDVDVDAVDDGFEDTFRASHPWLWLATLVGPFVTTVALLGAVYVHDPEHFRNLLAAAVGTFFFLGRFVILLGEGNDRQAPLFYAWELMAMVLYMDLVVAILLSFHLSLLYKLPRLGARLHALEEDGRFVLAENPWMRHATFLGVVVFVTFPLAATGSIGGSIFGRLLGMSRVRTLVGVATGSILGCAVMYFGATFINRLFDGYPIAKYVGGGAFLLVFIWVLNARYRSLKARRQTMPPSDGRTGAPSVRGEKPPA